MGCFGSGLAYMFGGAGCVLAAATAERLSKRYGVGPVILLGLLLTIVGWGQVIKALTSFVLPDVGMRGIQRVSLERAWEFQVAGAIFIVLAGVMAMALVTSR